jgi:Na+/citrate or Na+/malate symporter
MIIPGYIVNSLFGIGKIPVIGSVLSGILTGGEGGGLFGLRYEYVKNSKEKEGKFTTNKVSAFVPSTIQNLFSD